MLGITFHNPATISVFLDRMRFRDCFISNDELRKGEWERKLKSFVDLPSDGRDRVLFVESFATLQGLVQHGAPLESVKVAVYDDCNVLSNVPGANIVDAHINGSSSDTWQLYTVSFAEFNDALASQPVGVPALIRDHDVKLDDDIPEPPRATKQTVDESDDDADEAPKQKPKPASALVMEQILDDIEQDDEDDEEPEPQPYQPERLPDEALVALPEPDRGRVVLRKREPGEVQTQAPPEPEPTGPMEVEPATAEQIVETVGATEEEKEVAREILETVSKPPERKPKPKPKPAEPESEQPKTKKRRKRSKKPEAPQSYKLF